MQSEFNTQDARLLLISFFITAFVLWALDIAFLLLFSFVYSVFYFYQVKKKKRELFFYKKLSFFCIAWFLCIYFMQIIEFEDFNFVFTLDKAHFFYALHFILKIFLLALLGLNLFLLASPKEYALALVYFASFFNKENGWKVGLISLIILKYFYEFYALCTQIIKISSYRLKKHLSIRKRIYYFTQNLLRILVDKNYALSIALFARGFNKREVFEKDWLSLYSIENLKKHSCILLLNIMPCLVYLFFIL